MGQAQERDGDVGQLFQAGTMVDQFRVVRRLGRGGMGEVYLARDTRLGRKVAIKVVRQEKLGTAAAVDRFLFEARTTALFSHPHIVTVFAAGEHEGHPYVVLEYLEGQSLRQRMDAGRLGMGEALRLAVAVAEALAEAHGHGVLHRDLKPENVVLSRDGRPRVVDFGLASLIDPSSSPDGPGRPVGGDEDSVDGDLAAVAPQSERGIRGTPAYMAPEQWMEEEVGPAADIWAMGVMLVELLYGTRPYEAFETSQAELAMQVISPGLVPLPDADRELPEDLQVTMERCLRKDADTRPSAAELVSDLNHVLHATRRRGGREESPFRGLEAFSERHAEFFYGRDADLGVALERLRTEPLLAVVGPSGAGKSSFVHAGIVPRVREQTSWTVVDLRPGRDPFGELATALTARTWGTVSRTGSFIPVDTVAQTDPDIVNLSAQATAASMDSMLRPGARVSGDDEEDVGDEAGVQVRLADQLREHPRLLNLRLAELAARRRSKVLLIVDQLEELYTHVEDDELRRAFMTAICTAADDPHEPVRVVIAVRDDFLGRLAEGPEVRDALGRVLVLRSPAGEALEEILTRPLAVVNHEFEDPALVQEMIEEVRGEPAGLPLLQFAARAMWDRRDKVRRQLTRTSYRAIGGVAGALADHANGVIGAMSSDHVRLARQILLRLVHPDGTRRTLGMSRALEGLGEGGAEVLARLTRARLVTVRRSPDDEGAEARVEISHESLVRSWRRLARWLEHSSEERAFLAEVERAAELWEGRGCREEEVWVGDAYRDARRSLDSISGPVPDLVRRFLDAARERERRLARRKRLRRTGAIAALVVIAVMSVVVAVAFNVQRRAAVDQRAVAEERGAAAQREAATAAYLRGDPLEARARLRGSLELRDTVAARAAWWKVAVDPRVWVRRFPSDIYDAAWSPDGATVAAACMDGAVYVIDAVTSRTLHVLRGHPDQVFDLAFSADGSRLVSVDWSGVLLVWDRDGNVVARIDGVYVYNIDVRADGRKVAGGTGDGLVIEWDVATGERREVGRSGGAVNRVLYTRDGSGLLTTGYGGGVRLWNLSGGGAPVVLDDGGEISTNVVQSSDGATLATVGQYCRVELWDLARRQVVRRLGTGGFMASVAISPDGRTVAGGGSTNDVLLWDLSTGGDEPRRLSGHRDAVYAVEFDPTGRYLLSASLDQTICLWDTAVMEPRPTAEGHEDLVTALDVSRDGTMLASGSDDGTVRLWDTSSGAQLAVLRGHEDPVFGVAFDDAGDVVASIGGDAVVRLWDTATGAPISTLVGHQKRGTALAFIPGTRELLSVGLDRALRRWDTTSGEQLQRRLFPMTFKDLAISDDGRRVALAGWNGELKVVSTDTLREVCDVRASQRALWGVALTEHGERVMAASEDGTVTTWDVATGRELERLELPGRPYRIDLHPDGVRLGIPLSDGTSWIRSGDGDPPTVLRGHRGEVGALVFARDGEHVFTAADDGTVRAWNVATGQPSWRAPLLLAAEKRLLTHRGWLAMPGGRPVDGPRAAWSRAVERDAVEASASEGAVCLRTADDVLQAWDRRADRRWALERRPGLRRVAALGDACVTLEGDAVIWHDVGGTTTVVEGGALALSSDEDGLLVATADGVIPVLEHGTTGEGLPGSVGVSCAKRIPGGVVLGFGNGNLEVHRDGGGDAEAVPELDDTPSSPVVRMVQGPLDTLVVGFANGLVAIWSMETGERLLSRRLHGAVCHLALGDGTLMAATELGDWTDIDMGVFYRDRCDLLDEVWRRVPVVWEDEQIVVRPPPDHHACRR